MINQQIGFNFFKDRFSVLYSWILTDLFYNDNHLKRTILINEYNQDEISLSIFTETNEYILNAKMGPNQNYLGCTSKVRKNRTGENWTRGSDLPYGKYKKETWDKIKNKILTIELLELEIQGEEE